MTKINGFLHLVSKRKYFLIKTKIRVKLYGLNLRIIPKHGGDCQNGTLSKTFSKIYNSVLLIAARVTFVKLFPIMEGIHSSSGNIEFIQS